MDLNKRVAVNIKNYRIYKGFTQKELASRVNTSRTHISAIERFKKNVSIDMVERIANKLDIEPYKLLK